MRVQAVGSTLLGIGILAYVLQTSLASLGFKVQGNETGFNWRKSGQKTLALESDAGDLLCLVRLKLRWADPNLGMNDKVTAQLSNKEKLSVRPLRNASWFDLEKLAPKPSEKFAWPSGLLIELQSANGEVVTVDDWEIFLDKGERDSMAKARFRYYFKIISLIIAVPAFFYLFYKQLREHRSPEQKLKEFTPNDYLRFLISQVTLPDVEGSRENTKRNRQDTKRMQAFLKRWLLDQDDRTTALGAMGPDLKKRQRERLATQAIGKLRRLTSSFKQGLDGVFPLSDID